MAGGSVLRLNGDKTVRPREETFAGVGGSSRDMTQLGWRVGILVSLLLAAALMLPVTEASAAPNAFPSATANNPITATLHVGGSSTLLTRAFFGVNVGGDNSTESDYLNSTYIRFIRTAGLDDCNVTTGTKWTAGVTVGVAIPNGCGGTASFASWCDSLTPHCVSEVGLPGENNNSAEDAYDARYIVDTLGFQPTYWSIGNEAFGWTHYGIPWQMWKITDDSVPTGTAYAVDVRNAIRAVRAVDPAAQFIGIQSYWCPDTYYTEPLAVMDGDSVSALACHLYPNAHTATPTTAQYFSTLISSENISSNYYSIEHHIKDLCTRCSSLPIQISELQGGPPKTPAPQDVEFDGAVWLAATLVQALNPGISSVQTFELHGNASCGYCLLSATDVPDPQGILYSDVLSTLLDGHPVYNVSVTSTNTNLWATLIHGFPTNETQILFVNANLTHSETFRLSTKFFSEGQPGSIISWSESTSKPVVKEYAALPSRVTVPALGLVLISVTPKSSVPDAPPTILQPRGPAHVTKGWSAAHALRLGDAGSGFLSLPTVPRGPEGRAALMPPFDAEPQAWHGTTAKPGSWAVHGATGR